MHSGSRRPGIRARVVPSVFLGGGGRESILWMFAVRIDFQASLHFQCTAELQICLCWYWFGARRQSSVRNSETKTPKQRWVTHAPHAPSSGIVCLKHLLPLQKSTTSFSGCLRESERQTIQATEQPPKVNQTPIHMYMWEKTANLQKHDWTI